MMTSPRGSIGSSLIAVTVFLAASILAACGGSGALTLSPSPSPSVILAPAGLGGSNYGWYHVALGCDSERYGVVYNYDRQRIIIDAQLRQMYVNGQRRLRIPIFFGRGVDTGTVMDSTGGNLAPRFRTNLTNLLVALKTIGFVEIEVSFHPQGANRPWLWTSYSDDYFQENWNLIQNLHPLIAGVGIPYHLDLMNEGTPNASQPVLLEYDQNLWNDYVAQYGKDDTLGFSIIGDAGRASQVSSLYGPSAFGNHGSPPVFDVHFYDNAASSFADVFSSLRSQGYQSTPWIIGEAYYNDATEAAALRGEISSTGQTVLYVTQWPDTPATASCGVSIAPPVNFSNYQVEGF